jgi:hypothetical protein
LLEPANARSVERVELVTGITVDRTLTLAAFAAASATTAGAAHANHGPLAIGQT